MPSLPYLLQAVLLTVAGMCGLPSAYAQSGTAALLQQGLGASLPIAVRQAMEPSPRSKACVDIANAHTRPSGWLCELNASAEAKPSFVVFGDSHASQLAEAFEAAAVANRRRGVTTGYSGCPPLLGIYPTNRPDQATQDCNALNKRMLDYVRQSGIKDVFLVAKWSYYTGYWSKSSYINAIGLSRNELPTVDNSRKALEQGFANTVKAYARDLGVRLYVVEQVPQQTAPPQAIYEAAWKASTAVEAQLRALSVRRSEHVALQSFAASVFARHASVPGVQVVNLDDAFCDAEVCLVGKADSPYYQDMSHLNAIGAKLVVPRLTKLLQRGK